MTFNKETVVLDQNINIFPFLIMKSYIDDFNKTRSHDTSNLISSDAKNIGICWPSLGSIGKWSGQLKTTKQKIWDFMILEL